MRAIFDTNVLLSAFITDGLYAKILLRARNDHFELFSCPFILKEFGDKLHRKFSATQTEIRKPYISSWIYRLLLIRKKRI